jgi:cellulose synthase/poly-beta-1,6-N-acetylglucosamine synthase-like glycosyltransferase
VYEQLIPEYINYWFEVGFSKFLRVFWYFCFFEFTRYIVLDFIVFGFINTQKSKRERANYYARQALYIENPLVSIIIPGKNEGENLYKLTKSLSEQTYTNFELIIVDDGSDDNTPIIGKNLEKLGLIDRFF